MDGDCSGREFGLAHNAAQTSMSVDPAEAAIDDGQMELGWPWLEHHHVARPEWFARRRKAEIARIGQPLRQFAQSQRITGWHGNYLPAAGQRGDQQPDAVKPGGRIAPVQAKPRAKQRFGRARQSLGGHWLGAG